MKISVDCAKAVFVPISQALAFCSYLSFSQWEQGCLDYQRIFALDSVQVCQNCIYGYHQTKCNEKVQMDKVIILFNLFNKYVTY